jgi:diguanylate cyclase (GGDEF)-like protein
MNDRLREELLRSSRNGLPFTFLLLDVDHFKKINDDLGHPAGDATLVNLANLLKRSCRASDAICRYGGEEIAIILVDTALSGAKVFAENLRKLVEAEKFLFDGKKIPLTVSIGLAEFPAHGKKGEDLIQRADQALYLAKNAGRNSVKSAS